MIPKPKPYIQAFEQLGFGIFLHFGLYSILQRGEWVAEFQHFDMKEYEKLMESFTVDDMAHAVTLAKDAGAKYITLTTRHHDGFSLYDTHGLNHYDAPHAACGRDLVKEFVDACRKNDIVPFFYHTLLDWWKPEFQTDFPSYLQYLRDSVKLLCTNYGTIGGFWFDGSWARSDDWEEDALYSMIRRYQPQAMIINNTGLSALGQTGHAEIDSVTFERGRAFPLERDGMEKYVAGEVCDSINAHWGIANDFHAKSPSYLIESICDARKVGANYLLNIGPKPNGDPDQYSCATLEMIGGWMRIFGTAVYNGRPLWYKQHRRNFVLKDVHGDALYIFCYGLPVHGSGNVVLGEGAEGPYLFDGITDMVQSVFWMDNDEPLRFWQNESGLTVDLIGYPYGTDYCVRVAKAILK